MYGWYELRNLAWAHKRPYAYNHTHKHPNMHKWFIQKNTHTHTHTHRQTDTHTDTHTNKQTNIPGGMIVCGAVSPMKMCRRAEEVLRTDVHRGPTFVQSGMKNWSTLTTRSKCALPVGWWPNTYSHLSTESESAKVKNVIHICDEWVNSAYTHTNTHTFIDRIGIGKC